MKSMSHERSLLKQLVSDAKDAVGKGSYNGQKQVGHEQLSLRQAILQCRRNAIIAEIKFASPSRGLIRNPEAVGSLAKKMIDGGAVGLSVVTAARQFNGSMSNLIEARRVVSTPILMKDFVVHPAQIDAAKRAGADAVLLILEAYRDGLAEYELESMISHSHKLGLEVLLETHSLGGFKEALGTKADLIGINNRDLKTMQVDLDTTRSIISKPMSKGSIIISESGFENPLQIRFYRSLGVHAFLVGSALMASEDIESKVRSFVEA